MYRILGADGKVYGPITADVLRQWIAEGRANAATFVLPEGAPEWKALGTLPEFSLVFAASRQAPAVLSAFPARRTNGLAMTGFILALMSFSLCCCCYGAPCNILGVVFSVIGLVQIRNNRDVYTGQGFAIAGLVISLLNIVMFIVLLLIGAISSSFDNDFPRHVYRL